MGDDDIGGCWYICCCCCGNDCGGETVFEMIFIVIGLEVEVVVDEEG